MGKTNINTKAGLDKDNDELDDMDEEQLQAEIDKVESALNKTGKTKKTKAEPESRKRD
jgi:hypothetical protein